MSHRAGWPEALESLNDYCKNSYDLPSDHSLISPIARVILQKRRLLKIQEIHSLLLEASCDPSESLIQGEYEKDYLNRFRPTFSMIRWNELSVCEAQAFSSLIVDTLLRCQADVHLINLYINDAVAEIQDPDLNERSDALRSTLILIRSIFVTFPKQASQWARDLLKAILRNFKLSEKKSTNFDFVLESLRCLRVIMKLPVKYFDEKDRERALEIVSKYLKATSPFIAIEAAKVYEAYYEGKESISKSEVKGILEVLNGGLSFRLYDYKCSPRLLEMCFESVSEKEKSQLDLPTLNVNIARVRNFNYIDPRLFSDAFANVLAKWPDEELSKVIPLLISRVSSKCFAKTIEFAVERCSTYSQSIKLIRLVLSLVEQGGVENSIEIFDTLIKLYKKYPESLNESDFTNFTPLTLSNDLIQVKSVELISAVLTDKPIILIEQIEMIFAQLKGDFLRLKLDDKNVSKDAVRGLLVLFAKILKIASDLYSNYCDHEFMKKIQDWIIDRLTLEDDINWLCKENTILRGLLLVAGAIRDDCFKFTSTVIEFMNNARINNYEAFIEYFFLAIDNNSEIYKLFYGSIEKCFHELNIHQKSPFRFIVRKLVPLMKIIVDNKKIEYNSVATVCFIAKAIAFAEFNTEFCVNNDFDLLVSDKSSIEFVQFTELFAKIYWRCSEQNRDYFMELWLSSLKNKTAMIPSQILQMVRAILECSDIKSVNNEVVQIQGIVKEFLLDDNFEVRLECGIVLGSIVRLFMDDDKSINVLFEQFMKHALKSGSKEQQSRVCYIMGLVTLKANLELDHIKSSINLPSNALIGLISSWNRENNLESRVFDREIAAASIYALAFYIEKCGCAFNSEFYRDSCELLLEQVFMRDRCDKMINAILELSKSLGLYANLLPSQSQFITRTLKLLMETNFLGFYANCNADILVEISRINPQIATPSALIYDVLKKCNACYKRGAFARICQYLHLQVSFDSQIALELIDTGVFFAFLERANNPECFDEVENEALSLLVQQMIHLTLLERFEFWMTFVFEPMNLNGGGSERRHSVTANIIEVSNSTFSLQDLRDNLNLPVSLGSSTVLILLGPLSQHLTNLINLDLNSLRKFLSFAIRMCVNISAEKFNDRKFYLAGVSLFRGIVRLFSSILDESQTLSILEPFDSQIVSVISSALRCSEEGDPLYAASAFGTLFSLLSNRKDLHEGLKSESGRVYTLLKKACTVLVDKDVNWSIENVHNLVLLSIIVGMCSLHRSGFDLNVLDSEISNILVRRIGDCFVAYKMGTLDKNVKLSLSVLDRFLLIESLIQLEPKISDSTVIDGMLNVLIGLNSDNMEKICSLSMKLFELKSVEWNKLELLENLLNEITSYGIDKRDHLAIECILNCEFETGSHLNKLSKEFLTSRFSDFDSQYGLAALKAQQSMMQSDQKILFDILKKLVNCCLNDLEVNHCKDTLTCLKTIFTHQDVSEELSNDLILNWIELLKEIDSVFLNQLVFFVISSRPQIFTDESLKELLKHFKNLLKNTNTIEMALDSWILLLKAQSKNPQNDSFNGFVNICTEQVERAFEKDRGVEIDPVWERIFSIAQNISKLENVKHLVSKSLEELNDFK